MLRLRELKRRANELKRVGRSSGILCRRAIRDTWGARSLLSTAGHVGGGVSTGAQGWYAVARQAGGSMWVGD